MLNNINLQFYQDAKIGIVGPNGVGKSTLMKIMAGIDNEFTGEAWPGEYITVGYLAQEPELDTSKTVWKTSWTARARSPTWSSGSTRSAEMGEDGADFDALWREMGELQEKIDAVDGWTLDNQLEIAMEALRCPPGDSPVDNLSGGEKRRVALTRLLLQKPGILLLDEPTNHLDAESVQWLEKHLMDYPGACILVTHDRYFLDHVVELDPRVRSRRDTAPTRETTRPIWRRRPSASPRKSARKAAGRRPSTASWNGSGRSPKARQAKSKARIEGLRPAAESAEEPHAGQGADPHPGARRLGGKVIEVKGVSKAYGDKLLFEDLSFTLPPGGIVGMIGPNGAGKTTLFKLITGQEQPDTGEIEIGETVHLGYRRPEPRRARSQAERVGGDLRRARHTSRSASTR